MIVEAMNRELESLNPCCNGIYLIIVNTAKQLVINNVLILVVMEYT